MQTRSERPPGREVVGQVRRVVAGAVDERGVAAVLKPQSDRIETGRSGDPAFVTDASGLIQNRHTRIRTGIPLLSRIPVLGYLFGAVEDRIEKTELLLLITPRTVGTAIDAARITDQMRRVTPELEESIRQAPRQP